MGLLTDSSEPEKFSNFIVKWHWTLSAVCYLCGTGWFLALAFNSNNAGTYISENALLPGLVDNEFNIDIEANSYLTELQEEMENHKSDVPTAWLQMQFRHLGLEVFVHNFTLHYPLGDRSSFEGNNVYAIMRAPRAPGTEALVLSVPFRPPTSVHQGTAPGVALMIALTKFFRRRSYWSKDLIFLITEHEQLGARAWLDAYYGVETNNGGLDFGKLASRSGKIQAAINLELHGAFTSSMDVKIEGLTGQLPNLDLFNLVVRLCDREGIPVTLKNRANHLRPNTFDGWKHQLGTMMAMVKSHATGVPSGNHGHFLRYGIETVTLEGHNDPKLRRGASLLKVGRVLEGTFRSLNNLLESLHQSFFFYLLPATNRYVSIGLYMPPFGLILLPAILGALSLRIKTVAAATKMERNTSKTESVSDWNTVEDSSLTATIPELVLSHLIGLALSFAPPYFDLVGHKFELNSGESLLIGTTAVFISVLAVPMFLTKHLYKSKVASWEALKCVALLELSLLLATTSLVNFSLALLVAVFSVPIVIVVSPSASRIMKSLKSVLLILSSPLGLAFVAILYDTWTTHSDSDVTKILLQTVAASKRAILYSVTDSCIYGNWLFPIACIFHYSTWIQFWCVLHKPVHSSASV